MDSVLCVVQARQDNVNDLTQILLSVGTAFEEVGRLPHTTLLALQPSCVPSGLVLSTCG